MSIETIQFSGIIAVEYDDWSRLVLMQPDGLKIDLVNRFLEIKLSFPKKEVTVSYWISDNPCSKREMLEGWLKNLYGDIEAGYEANDYHYSSWTSGTDYDVILTIGGHNLYNELYSKKDKFIILEISLK